MWIGRGILIGGLAFGIALAGRPATRVRAGDGPTVSPKIREMVSGGKRADAYVIARGWPDLGAAQQRLSRVEKTRFVVDSLRSFADQAQAGLRTGLRERGLVYHALWLDNALRVSDVSAADLDWLAARDDVVIIEPDAQRAAPAAPPRVMRAARPRSPGWSPLYGPAFPKLVAGQPIPERGNGIPWGVRRVGAPELWARGIRGQGIVIADLDTGARADHVALISAYRGTAGAWVTDEGSWYDPVAWTDQPVDEVGHGTHTLGTLIGDDGAGNQIGVAPGAQWIACRNMAGRTGIGAVGHYVACFQFALAPTNSVGDDADPTLAADITSNSWACDAGYGEPGCDRPDALARVVGAVEAAGVLVVSSAGNEGASSCGSVGFAPGMLPGGLAVGAILASGSVAPFSSRGPSRLDGARKPDVVAPGADIYSAAMGDVNAYRLASGTSMAAPHVAGAAALLLSAAPWLRGQVEEAKAILRETARPLPVTETCGNVAPGARPNNVSGYGIVDAAAAVQEARALEFSVSVPLPGGNRRVTVTNVSAAPRAEIAVLAAPARCGTANATPVAPAGCGVITTTLGTLAPGATSSVEVIAPLDAPITIVYRGLAGARYVPVGQ